MGQMNLLDPNDARLDNADVSEETGMTDAELWAQLGDADDDHGEPEGDQPDVDWHDLGVTHQPEPSGADTTAEPAQPPLTAPLVANVEAGADMHVTTAPEPLTLDVVKKKKRKPKATAQTEQTPPTPPAAPPIPLSKRELHDALQPVAEAPDAVQQQYLIPPEELAQVKGKTLEALAYSRQMREDLVRLFRGLVPQSVMLADKASRDEADAASGTYEASGQLAKKRAKGEIIEPGTKAFEVSGRGGAAGALSKFPQNIGRSMLLLYSNELQTVVDPFAGHNSRMEFCVLERRHYYGQDLSAKFVAFNRARAKILKEKFPEVAIELREGNSQVLQFPDAVGDFTITSPPYWDIEYYGDEVNQLGFASTYNDFIDGLALVAKENYRCLKPGAFCVWYINDFRKGGKFYPYHVDTMHILNAAGFVTWDISITDFGRTFRSAFVNQIVQQKILPKKHEYGWVMRKPGWEKK